jgi:DNA polymerase epsilon subunit 2
MRLYSRKRVTDALMKVSLNILQRVYEAAQDADSHNAQAEILDPDSHLTIIDAFKMPLWRWSVERGTFEKCVCHALSAFY